MKLCKKKQRMDEKNNITLRLATQFVRLPYTLVMAISAGVRQVIQGSKSDERLRREDQQHQSRARRKLRGLPRDHVQQ
jgi:hypothetical protein